MFLREQIEIFGPQPYNLVLIERLVKANFLHPLPHVVPCPNEKRFPKVPSTGTNREHPSLQQLPLRLKEHNVCIQNPQLTGTRHLRIPLPVRPHAIPLRTPIACRTGTRLGVTALAFVWSPIIAVLDCNRPRAILPMNPVVSLVHSLQQHLAGPLLFLSGLPHLPFLLLQQARPRVLCL